MKKSVCLIAFLVAGAFALQSCCENGLQPKLENLVSDFPGEVGIALINGDDTVCVNANEHFSMFSVVKFHQALVVCDKLRNEQVFPSDETHPNEIKVTAEDLKPDTWSPMREAFPDGGEFSVFQLLEYSLVESDNNACDILFEKYGDPSRVESVVHAMGITGCGIARTEDEQHVDISRCYDNWTTPLAATQLLGEFYEERDRDEYAQFLWKTMANCQTGTNRIPKHIADSAVTIVHKTGTGTVSPEGKIMGINDIACIVLPDGSHFELAVFIKDAACEPAACEELIAEIAKVCFEEIKKQSR